jgi:hypothetical protein
MFMTLHASIIADPWGGILTYRFWPDKKTIPERIIALEGISRCNMDQMSVLAQLTSMESNMQARKSDVPQH